MPYYLTLAITSSNMTKIMAIRVPDAKMKNNMNTLSNPGGVVSG